MIWYWISDSSFTLAFLRTLTARRSFFGAKSILAALVVSPDTFFTSLPRRAQPRGSHAGNMTYVWVIIRACI
ncbi:hypothetical protein BKA83DRAFT_1056793 [Pisolithus microcarpus]|nr:hypothetical protein BKA83DRAFT_1056793 [Pisolithus microcarpus]